MSRQKYYRCFWRKSKKQEQSIQVIDKVNSIRSLMPRIGTRKLYHLLEYKLKPLSVGRDKLFNILKANDMLIKPTRNYRITTNSHHRFHKHKNLVESMRLEKPEQVWVSDITYIGGRSRDCYLALVTDAYSKKIMGYDLSDSLSTQGALRALNMANNHRDYKNTSLIHHSDRGIQYCSNDYQTVLIENEIIPSMTESYDPYANAVAERVNGILKQEFLLEDYNVDLDTMKEVVDDAVHIYNSLRPHWSCFMNTPEQMHKQNSIDIRTYKKSESCKASLATL